MNVDSLLKYLNNVENWYFSRNKNLSVIATQSINAEDYVIYKVEPLGTDSASKAFSALENVLSAMEMPGIILFYCIQGVNGTIQYYYGISIDTTYHMDQRMSQNVLSQASMVFEAVYTGNFPGNPLIPLSTIEKCALAKSVYDYCYAGVLEGVPGEFDTSTNEIGANNVNRSMSGDNFLVVQLARPLCLALDNQISCNIEEITSQLEPLANRTENCVHSDSKNSSFNVNEGHFCSNSYIRGNTEVRREYRFTDNNGTTVATPAANRSSNLAVETNEGSTQSATDPKRRLTNIERANDLEDAVFEGEFQGTATSFANLVNNDLLEEEDLEPMEIKSTQRKNQKRVQNKVQNNFQNKAKSKQEQLPQKNCQRCNRRKRMQLLNIQALRPPGNYNSRITNRAISRGLGAPNLPFGTTLASQLVGGSLPLIDGDFMISDIERQISLSNSNTLLKTNSDNLATTQSSTATRTKTSTRNISNRNAYSWVRYNENLLYSRLDVGKSQGLYLYTTGLFADSNVTLIKLAAALKYTYNARGYNKIPVIMTNMTSYDLRMQAFCNFQIPEYVRADDKCEFSDTDILLHSNFSQCMSRTIAYGGNWLSSKELGSIFALPQAQISE
ncbi:MAG: hypothetical protein Q4F05_12535 [bacterium]|nr:hypothetical protein [bacterium]